MGLSVFKKYNSKKLGFKYLGLRRKWSLRSGAIENYRGSCGRIHANLYAADLHDTGEMRRYFLWRHQFYTYNNDLSSVIAPVLSL